MQDRFKFRVWVKDSEEYIQDEAGECHIMHNGELICGDWIDDGYCGHYDYFNDDEVIVESCTGLRDKNDKLIYDNDLIMIGNELYRVAIDDFGCRTVILDNNPFKEVIEWSDIVKIYYFHNRADEIKVVGNIHENADLLENKDE